jgi:hypothetical protein
VSGFTAIEKYYPKQDVYVSILTNLLSGEDKTDFNDKRLRLFDKISDLAAGGKLEKEIALGSASLDDYVGVYEPSPANAGKKLPTITIYLENGALYADLSNGTGKHMLLVPQTETRFLLPDVKQTKTVFEFIKENGKTVKLVAEQGKAIEFVKVK